MPVIESLKVGDVLFGELEQILPKADPQIAPVKARLRPDPEVAVMSG